MIISEVYFEKLTFKNWPLQNRLDELLNFAHHYLNRTFSAVVFINLVSRSTMREINAKIYPFKKESDVLAIPMQSKINSSTPTLLGEIYLNIEQSKLQSQEYGHTWLRECAFLILHAFMHLLKYDHLFLQEEELMLGLQREILNKLNISRKVK